MSLPEDPATHAPLTTLLRGRYRPWWARPAAVSLWVTLGVLGAVMGWPLLRAPDTGSASTAATGRGQGLPWQVRPDGAGGSEVFNLPLGRATLADVERLWGQDLKVALIAAPGQPPALEAYVEGFQASFVTGKLVVAFEAEPGWLADAWTRAPRRDIGAGAVRQHELSMDDLAVARSLPVAALSFVPSARLDEATVQQRFGAAPERHLGPAGEVQLFYPALGVAIALPPAQGEDAASKALIQYVPPAAFEARLRGPLLAAVAAQAASAGASAEAVGTAGAPGH